MRPITSILVGIDFTQGSIAALREAIRLGRLNHAPVRAVHVIDTLVAAELEEAMSAFQGNIRQNLIDDATQAWRALAATVESAADLPIDVRIDQRIRGILAAATTASADLLVIGARGTGTPDVGMGTIATSCVRHAMIPVLLVRDTQPGPFKIIVACVDFSPTSLAALEQAARVAAQDGAALHVLHVFDAPWHQLHYRAPTPEADPHFQLQYRAGLERRLAACAEQMSQSVREQLGSLQATLAVVDSPAHRSGIVDYAAAVGADLLVLGTRGRSSIRDLLLGSTAERTLRDSRCSVLAIKPDGFTHSLASGSPKLNAES